MPHAKQFTVLKHFMKLIKGSKKGGEGKKYSLHSKQETKVKGVLQGEKTTSARVRLS